MDSTDGEKSYIIQSSSCFSYPGSNVLQNDKSFVIDSTQTAPLPCILFRNVNNRLTGKKKKTKKNCMLNGNPETKYLKYQAQIFYQMIPHTFYILYQASTMKGVLRRLGVTRLFFRQLHGVITSMNFPHSKIWSMALQAWKPDLSAKLELSHISEVDLQLKEHSAPKSDVKMQTY